MQQKFNIAKFFTNENKQLIKPVSIYDNIDLIEYTDIHFINTFINKQDMISNTRYKDTSRNSMKLRLKDYLSTYSPDDLGFKHKVKRADHGWGRIEHIHCLSAAQFDKDVRSFLYGHRYTDIDMISAHPSFICELGKLWDLKTNTMRNFMKFKDKHYEVIKKTYLKEITFGFVNTEEIEYKKSSLAKELFISLMYGGTLKGWLIRNDLNKDLEETDFIYALTNELNTFKEFIYNNNPDMVKDLKTHWKENKIKDTIFNFKNSLMSIFMQTLESYIQEEAIQIAMQSNEEIQLCTVIPSQDGFMPLTKYMTENVMLNIDEYFSDSSIKFTIKPFSEPVLDRTLYLTKDQTINNLLSAGYHIISCNEDKSPYINDSSDIDLTNIEYQMICDKIDYNANNFSIKSGMQSNKLMVWVVDFDINGKDYNSDGNSYVSEMFNRFNELSNGEGIFNSSTDGNYVMLFQFNEEYFTNFTHTEHINKYIEYTESQTLKIDMIQHKHIDLMFSDKFEVIPPSQTISKITGELGLQRRFGESVFYNPKTEKIDDDHIYQSIIQIINDKNIAAKEQFDIIYPDGKQENYDDSDKDKVKFYITEGCKKNMFKKINDTIKTNLQCSGNQLWTNFGEVIKTYYDDEPDGLILFKLLSQNESGKKYDEHMVTKYYINIKKSKKSIGTLMYYYKVINENIFDKINTAYNTQTKKLNKKRKLDLIESDKKSDNNPDESDEETYRKWHDRTTHDSDFVDLFTARYGHNIIFDNGSMYMYWVDPKTGIGKWHNETISKNRPIWTKYICVLMKHELLNELKIDYDNGLLTKKDYWKMVDGLKFITDHSSRFSNIIRIATKDVISGTDLFDKNPMLIGFNNGVYDLNTFEFREYRHSDYITMSTGYDFIVDYDKTEEFATKSAELEELFKTILPNDEARNLLYQVAASTLDGIGYQYFFLLQGAGGNGKGLFTNFMSNMLGEYGDSPSGSLLTKLDSGDTASPDLYSLKNRRLIVYAELSSLINATIFKKLTGNDPIKCRPLYHELTKFRITATHIAQCNMPPNFDEKSGEEIVRRLKKFTFPNLFTPDARLVGKRTDNGGYYYAANSDYVSEEYQMSNRMAFLYMMLNVYKNSKATKGKGINFNIPDFMNDESRQLIEGQNVFNEIFESYEICQENDIKSGIPPRMSELWAKMEMSTNYRALRTNDRRYNYNQTKFKQFMKNMIKNDTELKIVTYRDVMYVTNLRRIGGEQNGCQFLDQEEKK